MAAPLTQLNSGLVFASDGTLNGWNGSAAWSSETLPAMCAFDPSPYVAATPAQGGSDNGGCRESWTLVDTDGTWYSVLWRGRWLDYCRRVPATPILDRGARNTLARLIAARRGTSLALFPVFCSTTALADLTAANDLLYVELRNGVYYLHTLQGVGAAAANQVCAQPYDSAVWKLSGYATLAAAISASASWGFRQSDARGPGQHDLRDDCGLRRMHGARQRRHLRPGWHLLLVLLADRAKQRLWRGSGDEHDALRAADKGFGSIGQHDATAHGHPRFAGKS